MTHLVEKSCVPCQGGVPPLGADELARLHKELGAIWSIVDGHHLSREYRFVDFNHALAFTNAVGALAEEEGHHPDLHVGWGYVRIDIWTHKIDGLTESDFVLAAKIEALPRP